MLSYTKKFPGLSVFSPLKTEKQGVPWQSSGQDSAAVGTGSISGQGTKIAQATWRGQKINKLKKIKNKTEIQLSTQLQTRQK